MRSLASILGFCIVLGAANVASAASFLDPFVGPTTSFYQFTWTTTASFFQSNPDGTTVSNKGSIGGSGDLALTPTATGFTFAFDGPGGHGSGTTDLSGLMVNEGPIHIGSIDYPFPHGVTDARPGNFASQGQLTLTPGALTLTYSDFSHSNTFGPNLDSAFHGTGVLEGRPGTSAPEPAIPMFVASALGLAMLWRRPSATSAPGCGGLACDR